MEGKRGVDRKKPRGSHSVLPLPLSLAGFYCLLKGTLKREKKEDES